MIKLNIINNVNELYVKQYKSFNKFNKICLVSEMQHRINEMVGVNISRRKFIEPSNKRGRL